VDEPESEGMGFVSDEVLWITARRTTAYFRVGVSKFSLSPRNFCSICMTLAELSTCLFLSLTLSTTSSTFSIAFKRVTFEGWPSGVRE